MRGQPNLVVVAEAKPDCVETGFATPDPLRTEIVSWAVLARTPVRFAHSGHIAADPRHLEAASEWLLARGKIASEALTFVVKQTAWITRACQR